MTESFPSKVYIAWLQTDEAKDLQDEWEPAVRDIFRAAHRQSEIYGDVFYIIVQMNGYIGSINKQAVFAIPLDTPPFREVDTWTDAELHEQALWIPTLGQLLRLVQGLGCLEAWLHWHDTDSVAWTSPTAKGMKPLDKDSPGYIEWLRGEPPWGGHGQDPEIALARLYLVIRSGKWTKK